MQLPECRSRNEIPGWGGGASGLTPEVSRALVESGDDAQRHVVSARATPPSANERLAFPSIPASCVHGSKLKSRHPLP